MKLEGEYTFDGPRSEVWDIVRDPEILATAVPGAQKLEKIDENHYAGQMFIRIGPVSGVFDGKLAVTDEVPPESYTLSVDGRGAPGFGNGVGHVQLLEQEDGRTLIKYDGELQVGGRIASVGQRLIDTAARSMIAQGLESLNGALTARLQSTESGIEVEYVPPSEAQFAAAVAKDMAREMMPQARTFAAALLVAVVAFVLGFLVGRQAGQGWPCCEEE